MLTTQSLPKKVWMQVVFHLLSRHVLLAVYSVISKAVCRCDFPNIRKYLGSLEPKLLKVRIGLGVSVVTVCYLLPKVQTDQCWFHSCYQRSAGAAGYPSYRIR